MLREMLQGLVIMGLLSASDLTLAQGPPGPVNHLMDVARDLFPEVDSERRVPNPKPGEPSAILTAKIRPDVALRRVRQAAERARVFAGGAVAGATAPENQGIRLAIQGSTGCEIGFLVVLGTGRETRIEVHLAAAEGAPPPVESLPAVFMMPEPVMRAFPLQD